MILALGETIMLGDRKYKVAAVLFIGERYYLLERAKRGVRDVALMPAVVCEKVATAPRGA